MKRIIYHIVQKISYTARERRAKNDEAKLLGDEPCKGNALQKLDAS